MGCNEEEYVSILKMTHLEQYVSKVIDYTQRYNNSYSSYYAPSNLIGKPELYPMYGDFPEAYSLRTYGNWWNDRECSQINYRPQDNDPLGAEDYVIVGFETCVVPREVCIYETFHPGAVIRIWAKTIHLSRTKWILLWEGLPNTCVHSSNIFRPLIKKVNYLTNEIKIEFNPSRLSYHVSLDAILLVGYQPMSNLQEKMIQKGIINLNQKGYPHSENENVDNNHNLDRDDVPDLFSNLPYEIVIHIFEYLDLKSLARCASVNKRWNQVSADPFLYQNLSLKSYWYLVNSITLKYFMMRCKALKKLDLSWCGNDAEECDMIELHLSLLMRNNSNTLTHISLGNCKSIGSEIVKDISSCGELVDLRLKNINTNFASHFQLLTSITKLVALDVTSSEITDDDLILVLKSNPLLKHLIVDLCENLLKLDDVVEAVVEYNKYLKTWRSWKTLSLTAHGIRCLGSCPNITELDVGWCLVNKDPDNCLKFISEGCPKLSRLILSEWRGLNDYLLRPIISECKELTQLDFLGILNITPDLCIKALSGLPKLKLLDISYCDNITTEEVMLWKESYPHVTIQSTII